MCFFLEGAGEMGESFFLLKHFFFLGEIFVGGRNIYIYMYIYIYVHTCVYGEHISLSPLKNRSPVLFWVRSLCDQKK